MGKKNRDYKSGKKGAIVLTVIYILYVALMYYLLLPALNIHSAGLWMFLLGICLLPAAVLSLLYRYVSAYKQKREVAHGRGTGILFGAFGGLLMLFFLLLFFGSSMFHASSYASIMQPEEYDFMTDINQSNAVSKIALMDTDSAILLGNREIGSLSDVVSQYNVSENYTQIDLAGSPVKVSALNYAGFFKYLGNRSSGIPGYVQVDPVGQDAQYVELDEGMRYVPSAYFAKDLKRHLRSSYPTMIFGNINFELDESGNPYYVASVFDYTIGIFGGETVKGAIVCNPVTGACEYYDVDKIPTWVDDVFDGDLLVEQYNWYGQLSNGFWNSIFGKKGCKKCTETIQADSDSQEDDDDDDESYMPDYGYVAKDGDIWIYTGVTSINDDASNIGFILVNQRTSEAHYYTVAGADESSAMAAAEGEVQEKGYHASFPSLVNVDDHPTYIMVLKDDSGIVKLYAMVNVESYNKVTTASDLEECFAKYRKLIGTDTGEDSDSSVTDDAADSSDTDDTADAQEENETTESRSFTIESIQYVAIDGNTYVYLIGGDKSLYKMKFSEDESLIYLKAGDNVSAECVKTAENTFRMKSFAVSQ